MIKFSSVSGLRRSICPIVMGLLIVSQFVHPSFAQNTENVPLERRAKLLQLIPDGLIILPSETVEKKMEQPFWVQDPSFFYFTSLLGAPGAILVMDGPKERSILFSGPDVSSFGMPLTDLNIANRKDWIEQSGISAVLSLSEFETYIQSRLNDGVQTIYLDKPRREKPSEAPPGFLEVSGFHRLWEQSIRTAFPAAKLASVSSEIDGLVWVKNVDEISQLRKNATVSAKALTSGMLYIRPEKTQRQAEGQVVGACLEEGAEGPSFWPWVMTGPNAHIQNVVKSF